MLGIILILLAGYICFVIAVCTAAGNSKCSCDDDRSDDR